MLPRAPDQGTARKWVTTWKPVRFRRGGAWRIGIVKNQVQQADGTWALLVEHASEGMRENWPAMLWAVHDPRLVVPIEAEP